MRGAGDREKAEAWLSFVRGTRRCAFNRRFKMRKRHDYTHPGGLPTSSLRRPIDPEVAVWCLGRERHCWGVWSTTACPQRQIPRAFRELDLLPRKDIQGALGPEANIFFCRGRVVTSRRWNNLSRTSNPREQIPIRVGAASGAAPGRQSAAGGASGTSR